jgi:methylenetetrahydrofolate dehydrogenase (NADP+)/methenyltetrahydrofolate cyclohydrolase
LGQALFAVILGRFYGTLIPHMILMKAQPLLEDRRALLKQKTEALIQTLGRAPRLAVILVGDDPASQIYVRNKAKAAQSVGFIGETFFFDQHTPPQKVFEFVQELNDNPEVDGILIQRPLPSSFSEKEVMFWVAPEKDVDCLHPENIGLLVSGNTRFAPCTPAGILMLLDFYHLPVEGKIACVIGRSNIVGKPLASMLLARNASIIQIHRSTRNPSELCRQADFLFVAAGSRHLVKREWIKPGAVVIDVGIHRDTNGKITGDVDPNSIESIVTGITPVPGGVGPMTIQMLLENTYTAALNQGK